MNFCTKCGLKLDSELSECPNCKNMSLASNNLEPSLSIKQTISVKDFNADTIINQQNSKTKESMNKTVETKNVKLMILKGGTENREFPLTKEICNIGRWDPNLQSHPEVDLSDEDIDAKVSRLHARIIKKDEGFYIEDLGSRNGTFLNREFKLVKGIQYGLKNGDELIIGHIFFTFKTE